ncbi:hypothetical protein RRG08_042747 [Elysia crispata]|uniref:Uncharacterized protein n=1 Tax=Elysia crispata TaxID=231223 RepID=A0AAE0XQM0_9GAST|nr:hypothetical protein RRG08_042747 [Elysia crispata]
MAGRIYGDSPRSWERPRSQCRPTHGGPRLTDVGHTVQMRRRISQPDLSGGCEVKALPKLCMNNVQMTAGWLHKQGTVMRQEVNIICAPRLL